MTCALCEHCQSPLDKEHAVLREGHSYHEKCLKCYFCSNTNLHNAEVFKGVIFCAGCSQRIFQGCPINRKTRNCKPESRRRKREKETGRQHRPYTIHGNKRQSTKTRVGGVLELTTTAVTSDSDTYSSHSIRTVQKMCNKEELSELRNGKILYPSYEVYNDIKKKSTDIGVTTEVTQELLQQINCADANGKKKSKDSSLTKNASKHKGDSIYDKSPVSDIRIAELGASTEIAHMALRKKSELPIIIKSNNGMKDLESSSVSGFNRDSDGSSNSEKSLDSTLTSKRDRGGHWLDRRIGSVLKMPYTSFKKNVLNRSSLISVLMSCDDQSSNIFVKKLKSIFREEIPEHQKRGVKRLYSTINKRRVPYKMGWLQMMANVSTNIRPQLEFRQQINKPNKCKHYQRSHSYRCMRAHVMRAAGPTKSELANFRTNILNVFLPPPLQKRIAFYKNSDVLKSQGCGSDNV